MTLLCERLSFDGPLMGHFIFGVILGGKGGRERATEAGENERKQEKEREEERMRN